jgi:hypothetical protein
MKRPPARYEFRLFARDVGWLAERISWRKTDNERPSAETYILSSHDDRHNVKIRDGRIEVKRLIERSGGLELWKPVLRRAFPLDRRLLRSRIGPVLNVTFDRLPEPNYDLWPFLHQLVVPRRDLAVARVSKHRCRFELGECLAEFVTLRINGEAAQSIAVESEQAQAVWTALQDLGLDAFENSSYPATLKQMLGLDQ